MKIYLAHPITGLSYDQVIEYYAPLAKMLSIVGKYEVLCPMVAKSYLKNVNELKASGNTNPVSTDHAIIERDCWMVSNADVVYIDLTGTQKISIGCVMELAWAYKLGKHTVIAMERVDPEEEPEKKPNPHEHAFVLEAADIIFETPEQAVSYLIKLAKGEM